MKLLNVAIDTYLNNKKKLSKQNIKYDKDKTESKYIIGVIDENNVFHWQWSLINNTNRYINENISYNLLKYALSIIDDTSELGSYQKYIRYLFTKSEIKLNSEFDLTILLSCINSIKKDFYILGRSLNKKKDHVNVPFNNDLIEIFLINKS